MRIRTPRDTTDLVVNMYGFDELLRETIKGAIWLKEYFRLNLLYYQLVTGKGLEFDRIRDYYVGADPRRIDWKKYAKSGKLNIRSFKEERQFDIITVVDVSDSMLLGTTEHTKNEFAAKIAGTIMFAAYEAGDDIGLVMISDKVKEVIDTGEDYVKLMSVLSDKTKYGGRKNWKDLVPTLMSMFGETSIIFIVSDFIDTNIEAFIPELASQFSKVYGIMIRDPIDNELPKGVGRMFLKDVYGNTQYLTDFDAVREEYELLCKRNVQRIRETFHEYDQLFFDVKPNVDFGRSFIEALGAEEVIIL